MSERITVDLTVEAVNMAVWNRRSKGGDTAAALRPHSEGRGEGSATTPLVNTIESS
ncbi:MAG: hypothetical protein ACOYEP_06960 [Limnochordia bacterium]|jgi:hypothetical protein